jgi:hypothetical protein
MGQCFEPKIYNECFLSYARKTNEIRRELGIFRLMNGELLSCE